jgi:hypothetical protein
VKITDSRIYVLDHNGPRWINTLTVFDTAGTGIGRVGRKGQGPGEYLQITNFDVNESGDVYLIDATYNNNNLYIYDKHRKFVSVKKMPFQAFMIQCLPNDKLLLNLSSWNEGENAPRQIAVTNMALEAEQTYLTHDGYEDHNQYFEPMLATSGNHILYHKPINNYMYEFSAEGQLLKAYMFDFGKKNVPDEDKMDIEKNLSKFEHYRYLKNCNVINDKYIFGTLWDEGRVRTFIVDRHSKQMYISNKKIKEHDSSNIVGYCNNQIVSYIYPLKYEDIQATGFPDNVKKHVEDENFVLCLYELK